MTVAMTKPRGRRLWRVVFRDHRRIARSLQAFQGKDASRIFLRNLHRLVEHAAAGADPPDDLSDWIAHRLSDYHRDRLIDWGILSRRRIDAAQPVPLLLDAWHTHLLAEGILPKSAAQQRAYATKLLGGFPAYTAVDPQVVQELIESLARQGTPHRYQAKAGPKPWSASTRRAHLSAAKSFCNWMRTFRGAARNPLDVLGLRAVPPDLFIRTRRALSQGEQRALIAAVADSGAVRGGMGGHDRSLFYWLAIATGLRASALRSLTVGCFTLAADSASVTPPSGGRKRRVAVPLTDPVLVRKLRRHLARKLPAAPAFASPSVDYLSDMLRADMLGAGLDPVGFHCLRHTFGSNAARAGVRPKALQELMGHSRIETTMTYYVHDDVAARAEHLAKVPGIGG